MLYAPSRGLRVPLVCGTLLLTQPYPLRLPSRLQSLESHPGTAVRHYFGVGATFRRCWPLLLAYFYFFIWPRSACPASFLAGHPGQSQRPSSSSVRTGASRQRCNLVIFVPVLPLYGRAPAPTFSRSSGTFCVYRPLGMRREQGIDNSVHRFYFHQGTLGERPELSHNDLIL